jgi:hypothetical protein
VEREGQAANIRNKQRENIKLLSNNYPYVGTIEEGKIVCCNDLIYFKKNYKINITYYFSKKNNATEFTIENTVKIIGTEKNCFENDIEEVTENDIDNLKLAIAGQAARAAQAAAKNSELSRPLPRYKLPTYIGYIENSVFRRIELSENSENLKKFLKNKIQKTSPIIMSNSDSYYNIQNNQYNEIFSKKFKNTSDRNTSIDNLIDNLKQTDQNADENIKQYVRKNFEDFDAVDFDLQNNPNI